MTGDLTGKHPKDSKKPMSEMGYAYAGSGYGGTRTGSEKGFTLRSEYRLNLFSIPFLENRKVLELLRICKFKVIYVLYTNFDSIDHAGFIFSFSKVSMVYI